MDDPYNSCRLGRIKNAMKSGSRSSPFHAKYVKKLAVTHGLHDDSDDDDNGKVLKSTDRIESRQLISSYQTSMLIFSIHPPCLLSSLSSRLNYNLSNAS